MIIPNSSSEFEALARRVDEAIAAVESLDEPARGRATELKDAIEERDSAGPVESLGDPIHVDPFGKVRDDLNNILYHDQSNVGLEQQVAEITKNHMQHNLALTIMNSQFRLLQTAVSERA